MIEALARELVAEVGTPVDEETVAALLESRGLRDVDARERYDHRDVFSLAHEVHARCIDPSGTVTSIHASPHAPAAEADDRERHWRRSVVRFARYYSRGVFFALPLAVQVACVVILGYGSWASVHFTTREATAVALGTICSFVVVGGFCQAIARLGIFYVEQHSFVLARQVMSRIALYGFAVASVVGSGLALVADWAGVLKGGDLAVALGYFVLLSMLFLSLAVLYSLQRRLAIMATMLVNLGLVVGLVYEGGVGTHVAHWIGLAAWSFLAATWGQVVLRRAAEEPARNGLQLAWRPNLALMSFTAWRHFLYGSLYFSFLFADRFVAWSAGRAGEDMPLLFRSSYEVGLDWALLSLILTVAMLEYTINDLSALVPPIQRRTAANQREAFNRFFRRLYLRHLLMLAFVAAISVNLTYFLAIELADSYPGLAAHGIVTDPIASSVFEVSAVAYSLVAVGLLNTVLFFSVSRPALALRPLALALVVDVAIGIALSANGQWWWSVWGLLVGAVVFAGSTTLQAARVLRHLDYYYYSA